MKEQEKWPFKPNACTRCDPWRSAGYSVVCEDCAPGTVFYEDSAPFQESVRTLAARAEKRRKMQP